MVTAAERPGLMVASNCRSADLIGQMEGVIVTTPHSACVSIRTEAVGAEDTER